MLLVAIFCLLYSFYRSAKFLELEGAVEFILAVSYIGISC